MGVDVRPLDNAVDPAGCDAVIRSLPYFFGDENGIREAARAVRRQEGWVAADGGEIVGFATIAPTFPGCLEITWLAVRADRRRSGLGRELVERVTARAIADGIPLLCVLTLGPSVEEPGVQDGYEGTRRFWQRVGFVPVKELSLTTWSDEHALLLVRVLGGSEGTEP
jgi:GNAT superfamily N-acetyltransferase